MNAIMAKVVGGLFSLLVTVPITLYLSWRIMHAVDATPVMWLLWWANAPLTLLVHTLLHIVGEARD